MWGNTSVQLPVKYKGEGLPEGTHLEFTLELAPELYVHEDGATDWDALGKGAIRTVPLTIDNTAPEILEISYNLVSNTMTVTAQDNQYIARCGAVYLRRLQHPGHHRLQPGDGWGDRLLPAGPVRGQRQAFLAGSE